MQNNATKPSVWLSSLVFSDGTEIITKQGDLTIFVGPNNSGKSRALRDIREKVRAKGAPTVVVKQASIATQGTHEDVVRWLQQECLHPIMNEDPLYNRYNNQISKQQAAYRWAERNGGLDVLSSFYCRVIGGENRILAANPPKSIALTKEAPKHPIHYLQWEPESEKSFSRFFREAFGLDLIVHRNAGEYVPLHVGARPNCSPEEGELSVGYAKKLDDLPALETQGDGMRAFVGLLLYALISDFPSV